METQDKELIKISNAMGEKINLKIRLDVVYGKCNVCHDYKAKYLYYETLELPHKEDFIYFCSRCNTARSLDVILNDGRDVE